MNIGNIQKGCSEFPIAVDIKSREISPEDDTNNISNSNYNYSNQMNYGNVSTAPTPAP